AAIEAARAGADGRGFAVVADEVRDLAAQSLHAAGEARVLLEEITSQVSVVSGQMERGRETVSGVEGLSADAARALDAIVGTTGEAGRHAREIAATAADQLRAVDGLTGQIRRVAAGSARTLSDTEARARPATDAAAGPAPLPQPDGAARDPAQSPRAARGLPRDRACRGPRPGRALGRSDARSGHRALRTAARGRARPYHSPSRAGTPRLLAARAGGAA